MPGLLVRVSLVVWIGCLAAEARGPGVRVGRSASHGQDSTSPPQKPDGTVPAVGAKALFGWGRNNAGQLGLGHSNDVTVPEVGS